MALRWRHVQNDQTVLDLVDIFQNDGFTRIGDLEYSQVSAQVFFNNALQAWDVVSGDGVTDAQIVSGKIYWSEVQSGIYGIRWRPNAVGFWRVSFTYADVPQIVTYDYDVSVFGAPDRGLRTSFIP